MVVQVLLTTSMSTLGVLARCVGREKFSRKVLELPVTPSLSRAFWLHFIITVFSTSARVFLLILKNSNLFFLSEILKRIFFQLWKIYLVATFFSSIV
jgi:hypothetical protein